jgi:peptidoglycan hydrolase CwlO-like protein
MFKKYSVRSVLAFCLAISILLVTFSAYTVTGQENLFSETERKMAGISEKEKETLQRLFTQAQVIEETEKKAAETVNEINIAEAQIKNLKKIIADDEAAYEKERESLKQVLQCYQRMGPASSLEIILESESLYDLLMRINTLRDLTRNTGKLLDRITEDRKKQSQEKAKLSEELATVQDKQQNLAQTLAKEKKLKDDLEKYLLSLAEERGHYQEYLNNLQQAWSELKPFISSVSEELSNLLGKVSLPQDALKISFDFFIAKVSIDDKTINGLLAGDPQLCNMTFSFHTGKVEIDFPDKNLALAGKFAIVDGHSLKFEATEGSFFGMPLDKITIAELLKDNNLELNLESQLEGNTLKAIDIMDGYLSLTL